MKGQDIQRMRKLKARKGLFNTPNSIYFTVNERNKKDFTLFFNNLNYLKEKKGYRGWKHLLETLNNRFKIDLGYKYLDKLLYGKDRQYSCHYNYLQYWSAFFDIPVGKLLYVDLEYEERHKVVGTIIYGGG